MKKALGYVLVIAALGCLGRVQAQESTAPPASAPAAQLVRVHIDAKPATQAIAEWAQATHYHVVWDGNTNVDVLARAVDGRYTPKESLKRLLAGTDLRYEVISDRTVAVRSAAADAPAAHTDAQTTPANAADHSNAAPSAPKQHNDSDVKHNPNDQTSATGFGEPIKLEEVVVTGSHIQGNVNPSVPIIVIDRAQIEASGYTTTAELAASLPQNFGGGSAGATADGIVGQGVNRAYNLSYGTGINLRGLGPSSTLVLVNGHRVAPSADGTFTDINMIPLDAIDRVEIMADGASAIYGADAVAGVVNFILRKNYNGQETLANYGWDTQGGGEQKLLGQTVGRTWTGGAVLGSVQVKKDSELMASERSFTQAAPEPTDLLPRNEQYSALFNIQQTLPGGFEISSDVLFSHSDSSGYASYAADPPETINTRGPTNQGVATVGLTYRPTDDWRIQASGSYSLWNTTVAQLYSPDVYAEGSDHLHNNYKQESAELIADGTLFALPGGPVKAAFGGSYQNERFTEFYVEQPSGSVGYARHLFSEFAELEVPLIGAANSLPWTQALELSLAVRHDDYTDFGTTTNPRYGLSWKPVESLRFRGAYSTSFRAPNTLEEITAEVPTQLQSRKWPSPAGGKVPVLILASGGPPLEPERSRNWTGGLEFAPTSIPNFKVSLDYFNIRYADRIETPHFVANALSELNVYGSLITPIPSDAAAEAYIAQIVANGGTFYNLAGSAGPGIRYLFNAYELNAALVKTSGVDFNLGYHFAAGAHEFRTGLNVAYLDQILTSYTATSTPSNVVNTYSNPLHVRARGTVGWSYGPWSLNTALNFSGRYTDTTTLGNPPIASWTTLDAQLAYSPPWVKGLQLSLSCTNLFDRNPPYVAGTGELDNDIHYDVGNASALGRIVVFSGRLSW